jgi:hypothetical protein
MAKKKATLPKNSHRNSGIASTEKAPGFAAEGFSVGVVMVVYPLG